MNQTHHLPRALSAVIVAALGLALTVSAAGPSTAAPGAPPTVIGHVASSAPASAMKLHPPADSNISFAPPITSTGGILRFSAATADFNRDGLLDVVTVDGINLYTMLSTGSGHFAPAVSHATGSEPLHVAVGDFNLDGKPDIVTSNINSDDLSVLLGNGDGTFSAPHSYPIGYTPEMVVVADLNNDGKPDLIVGAASDNIFVLFGNGNGTFQTPISLPANGAGFIGVADFNNDHKPDLLAYDDGSHITVLLGNGDGTFRPPLHTTTSYISHDLVFGDVNHDGNVDVIADVDANLVAVLLGNGDGTFQQYTYFPDPNSPLSIAAADFNGDGALDIVTVDGSVAVLAGIGDGNFQYVNSGINLTGTLGLAVADFNNDGKPDILTADSNGTLALLLNTSVTGQPTPTTTPAPTQTPIPNCQGDQLNPWSLNSAQGNKLEYIAMASSPTYAYAAGGYLGAASPRTDFARYDPTTHTWLALAPMPAARASAAAIYSALNSKVYVFGGYDYYFNATDSIFVYNIATNTWDYGDTMPGQRGSMVGGYWNGKIYLEGGDGAAQLWAYDPALRTWDTSGANMPTALTYPAAGLVNGHLYIFGGTDYHSVYSTTFDYNIAANSWTTRTNMPISVYHAASAVVNGRIYVFGGYSTYGSISSVNATQIYDPATDSWSIGPQLNEPRANLGGIAIGNYIVAVDGTNHYGSELNTTEQALVGPCNPQPTNTPAPTNTPSGPTPTGCANPFVDTQGNVFYYAISYLTCAGVINGTDATHFTPSGTATRGQFAKIVALGFGLPTYTPPGNPDFSDVPASYFAYLYIESGFHAGILSGFDQGGCTAHGVAYPCYLPNLAITRAQLTKLVVGAAHYPLYTPTSGQTFSDVPPQNTFYTFVETAHQKGVIAGYPDGTFRPGNFIRRDEMAQIVYKGVTTP